MTLHYLLSLFLSHLAPARRSSRDESRGCARVSRLVRHRYTAGKFPRGCSLILRTALLVLRGSYWIFRASNGTIQQWRLWRREDRNFVLAVAEGSFGGRPSSYYDFYRIQNGKIAEHLATVEPIAPSAEWKNSNGKF